MQFRAAMPSISIAVNGLRRESLCLGLNRHCLGISHAISAIAQGYTTAYDSQKRKTGSSLIPEDAQQCLLSETQVIPDWCWLACHQRLVWSIYLLARLWCRAVLNKHLTAQTLDSRLDVLLLYLLHSCFGHVSSSHSPFPLRLEDWPDIRT